MYFTYHLFFYSAILINDFWLSKRKDENSISEMYRKGHARNICWSLRKVLGCSLLRVRNNLTEGSLMHDQF